MAATRLLAIHASKGESVSASLAASTDYAEIPEKTEDGTLVSRYARNPRTADAEFMLSKQQYTLATSRILKNDVIANQFHKSCKPVEIAPQETSRIGCEFAGPGSKGSMRSSSPCILSMHTSTIT